MSRKHLTEYALVTGHELGFGDSNINVQKATSESLESDSLIMLIIESLETKYCTTESQEKNMQTLIRLNFSRDICEVLN